MREAIDGSGVNDGLTSLVHVRQEDILPFLSPFLAARSDTFVIRAYGEGIDPVTGEAAGCAWCEASIQRFPEYVDDSQPPETAPADGLDETNRILGRRCRILSFRWLKEDEI